MVLAAAVVCTAVVLALVAAGRLDAGAQPPAWRENTGLAIMVVGMVGVVAGMVWVVAAGTFPSGDLTRVRSFTTEQRRQAARTIRRGQPAPDGAQEVTAVTARITARQRVSSATVLGIVLISLGILLQTSSPSGLLLVGTGVILAGVALQLPNIRLAHRAQHWLDTTCP